MSRRPGSSTSRAQPLGEDPGLYAPRLHPGEYAVRAPVILREARKSVRGHDAPPLPAS